MRAGTSPAETFGPYLPPVIGISGAMGAGKSTLAKHLVEVHGYTRMSMAAPGKNMLRALGLTEEDVNGTPAQKMRANPMLGGRSARFAMQSLLTQWGRLMMSPDLWVNAMQVLIVQHQTKSATGKKKPPHAGVVIDDIRFPNEWDMVRRMGGVLWKVRRPDVEPTRTFMDRLFHAPRVGKLIRPLSLFLPFWRPIHESEYHWPDAPSDAEFWNTGDEAEMRTQASTLLLRTQP